MKNLLSKEFHLSLHQTNYIFLAMVFMLLIPNYPFYVAFFFPCLGIFYLFMNGREQNDIYFSVLLPVSKSDVVKSRYITVVIIEIVQILLAIPVGILRYAIIPEPNQAGIEANVAFYGLVLIMYALFNIIFLNRFYKSPDKIGGPFLVASIVQFLYIGIAEALVLAPTPLKDYLDTIDRTMMVKQLPILLAGIIIYILITFISYRSSEKSFEKIDL